ncbi:hypothetical protein [Halarsenatibacter silvermanii]|uniref:Uncharacterized protein n=1 Tax=Halarsenatibacter silvermanii TaxID=321763 RepID=A0A1G9R9S2_9FIRM|nr:hypothetical protein [Halarsenatibacter silvermanii]SDM19860.1 hypothetical protein SAMN04488692_1218 [Halarsenatibacter silvermanii]
MRYKCPICRIKIDYRPDRCPICEIPFSWIGREKSLPVVDNYRLVREGKII